MNTDESLTKFYAKVLEDLSYLRGRFDTEMPAIKGDMRLLLSALEAQEKRIDTIEDKQAFKRGQTNVISSIISAVVALAVSLGTAWIPHK